MKKEEYYLVTKEFKDNNHIIRRIHQLFPGVVWGGLMELSSESATHFFKHKVLIIRNDGRESNIPTNWRAYFDSSSEPSVFGLKKISPIDIPHNLSLI